MYKKIVLLVSTCFALFSIQAQVTMTPAVPPSGLLLKRQLWNILLVNNGANNIDVELTLVLSDAATNEPVLTASTQTLSLNTGARQLQESDLTIQYKYLSPLITDRDPNGFIDIGAYTACYTLNKITHSATEELAEDCLDITVEPISPPLLNYPADESISEPPYPQFNWLPPSPLNMFNDLKYDLLLVEIGQGQTAAEAVQQNVPVYNNSDNTNIFLNYPSSNIPLDTSKQYAWQVTAKNNNQFAAQSEVWIFKVRKDSVNTLIKDASAYTKLRRDLDASVTSFKGTVKVFYDNDADDSLVTYKISSIEEEDLGDVLKSGVLGLRGGENLLEIPLLKDDRLIDNRTYLLQLINSRNESWRIKFIYHPEEIAQE